MTSSKVPLFFISEASSLPNSAETRPGHGCGHRGRRRRLLAATSPPSGREDPESVSTTCAATTKSSHGRTLLTPVLMPLLKGSIHMSQISLLMSHGLSEEKDNHEHTLGSSNPKVTIIKWHTFW